MVDIAVADIDTGSTIVYMDLYTTYNCNCMVYAGMFMCQTCVYMLYHGVDMRYNDVAVTSECVGMVDGWQHTVDTDVDTCDGGFDMRNPGVYRVYTDDALLFNDVGMICTGVGAVYTDVTTAYVELIPCNRVLACTAVVLI